jgi:membrane-bound ClpP family serine protease
MTNEPGDRTNDLERLANEKQPSLAAEFLGFLSENKKWWLLPILVLIGVFGIIVALASTGAAPFIYTLF